MYKGMGIDSMRVGGGRCPPLLVGGLLITCLMLICNWWTLSSENLELLRQIDELNEQIKISAEERDQCVTLRGNLEQKFKHAEGEIASLHVHLEQEAILKKKTGELEISLTTCKNELESQNQVDISATLGTLRLEKSSINETLEVQRAKNKKLQEELAKVKEECQEELGRVKLNCNLPKQTIQPYREVIGKTQLVPESAVKVSVAGQRGFKYHGTPILPNDPPGAVRLAPRYSVTMLKAPRKSNPDNGTVNHKEPRNQDEENDLRKNDANNEEENDNIQESDRDQQMKATNEYSDKPGEQMK